MRTCALQDRAAGVSLRAHALTGAALSVHFRETAGAARTTIYRGWGLGRGVRAGVGIGGGIGAGRGAGVAGLALVAAQVGQLLDGAEEAAAEVSVVAGQVN